MDESRRTADQKGVSLAQRLRCALEDANMKAVELSERTGIPKSMISYYLNGKTKPKGERLYIIAKELGVNEAWLLGYDVSRNETTEQNIKNDQPTTRAFNPQRLKEALDNAGMKQIDLARSTGINKSAITHYLIGSYAPKQKAVQSMALALGVSEQWLMGKTDEICLSTKPQNNDNLLQAIASLRGDSDFLEVLSMLASLPPDDYASFKRILVALYNKN